MIFWLYTLPAILTFILGISRSTESWYDDIKKINKIENGKFDYLIDNYSPEELKNKLVFLMVVTPIANIIGTVILTIMNITKIKI